MLLLATVNNNSVANPLHPGLALALILMASIAGGQMARLLRIPRVVGYLVMGVLLRQMVVWWLTNHNPQEANGWASQAIIPLGGIKTLALGMILFSMGSVLERSHLRRVGSMLWRISAIEIGVVLLLVTLGTLIANQFAGIAWKDTITIAILLGIVATATAPAATVFVLREYSAKGPLSDMITSLTASNNIAAIILFHTAFLAFAAFGIIETTSGGERLLWLDLAFTSIGSMALGMVLGFAFSVLYVKVSLPEFLLIFVAILLALGEGDSYLAHTLHLSFNFLLTCLFAGAVFANITLDQEQLQESLQTLGGPIFMSFFVLAGYELHLAELPAIGVVGVAYVCCRLAGKVLGARLGIHWAAAPPQIQRVLGAGMLCQAGVAIGLSDFLIDEWGAISSDGMAPNPLAHQFKTIVLGSIVVFELSGPILLKWIAVKSGEVKALSLFHQARRGAPRVLAVVGLAFEAFLRSVGLARRSGRSNGGTLLVRHIMRTNVRLLRHAANLDEVLDFVETSRYNHFPVVDSDGAFVGMVHFSDLREMIYDPQMRGPEMRNLVTALDLANPTSPSVTLDVPLETLLEVFREADVGSLAVVESEGTRRVVGVVEQRDLLRALHHESQV